MDKSVCRKLQDVVKTRAALGFEMGSKSLMKIEIKIDSKMRLGGCFYIQYIRS
jgi:hypothetical protein